MSTFKLFKDYQDYQSRKVDNPNYEPLGQGILIESPEELRRKKRKEYAKKYYAEHREHICELSRKSYNKRHGKKEITYEDIKSVHDKLVGKGYLDELADKISGGLIAQNKELYEENQKLKETLNKIKEAWIEHEKDVDSYYKKWQNSYGDLDQIIMNR